MNPQSSPAAGARPPIRLLPQSFRRRACDDPAQAHGMATPLGPRCRGDSTSPSLLASKAYQGRLYTSHAQEGRQAIAEHQAGSWPCIDTSKLRPRVQILGPSLSEFASSPALPDFATQLFDEMFQDAYLSIKATILATDFHAKITPIVHGHILQLSSMDETTGDLRWRQGCLAVGLPPGPVLALSGIVTFFLFLTWQIDEYEKQLRLRTQAGFWVLLVLGLLALVVLAHHALFDSGGRLVVPMSWLRGQQLDGGYGGASDGGSGTSPWVVAAVVALLLVLASHKPSFQMFRPPFYHK
ncbi:hypothetical protein HU200_013562 [Digitaria exilis]|uniref:Uncharacterized protein n=1 Tax=Digitaria exilis TaxID=1010633 RepID=A0A835KKX4_9POAL|nr:hypothetical protein HU200_013562 [Digitaria exilis]